MNNTLTTEKRPVREQNQVERVERGYVQPVVNIVENKEGYLLEAEMPGVNKEGLEVLLEGNELTIVGHRQASTVQAKLLYRETAQRDYRRAFVLDPPIDTSKITAKMENGVLKLDLPKAEAVKPRKIAVTD